ncbi:MAG: radical SAM protein [Candidatus Aenigmarchaeota archaeon]|nr:radical SAM protein [Candidatus Aenigmarchaeota archaeon]
MSILLINPDYTNVYRYNFMRYFYSRYPPLNLVTLSSSIENVSILDMNIFSDPIRELRNSLKTQNFDFVGVTVNTPSVDYVKNIIGIIRESSKSKIILGGPHVTSFPERSFQELKPDIVCEGEGDETIREIISGKPLKKIRGLWIRKNGKIFRTKKRHFIENLDSLKFPTWELLDLKKYFTILSKKNPTGTIETSRGCPYNCVYCHKETFGRVFRYKTPKRVVDEMEYLFDSGFKEIHVVDDAFTVNRRRTIEICDEVIIRGLDFPWALPNGIRVDTVDQKVLDKLHHAGCHLIAFGVETGSEKMLRVIDKGINIKQTEKAFKMAKDAGIETLVAFFMVGLPGEKEEDLEKTTEFARHLDADVTKVSVTIPYPGTRLYEIYKKDGSLIEDVGWASYRIHEPSRIYKHENLSWSKIVNSYYKILKSTYGNPFHYIRRSDKIVISYAPRIIKNILYGMRRKL